MHKQDWTREIKSEMSWTLVDAWDLKLWCPASGVISLSTRRLPLMRTSGYATGRPALHDSLVPLPSLLQGSDQSLSVGDHLLTIISRHEKSSKIPDGNRFFTNSILYFLATDVQESGFSWTTVSCYEIISNKNIQQHAASGLFKTFFLLKTQNRFITFGAVIQCRVSQRLGARDKFYSLRNHCWPGVSV